MPLKITSTEINDLFSTTPTVVAKPAKPVELSADFRMQLIGAIQEAKVNNGGYDPPNVAPQKRAQLEEGIKSGMIVQAKLSNSVTVLFPKSDDLEASKSFFYKTSGGFAGTQFFGPIGL